MLYCFCMRADISFVKTALKENSLMPNRALGQNFCIAGDRLKACVDALHPEGLPVVEVGPGLGSLTELLLEDAASVLAVEKDASLADYLRHSLVNEKLTVCTMDALKLDATHAEEGFAAVGNLPYYITTQLCLHLLKLRPSVLACMVQKEAAERFTAPPKSDNYGALSVLSQLFYEVESVVPFSEDCFYPQPNVHSVFLTLRQRPDMDFCDLSGLEAFVNKCLRMRRKTLKNNLSQDPKALSALEALGIDPSLRGETLSPEQFWELFIKTETL